jgi:phosphopantothenoylcysteine decarboxylase/phosphopantothenate--cysteine ligase
MWEHVAVKRNVSQLVSDGAVLIDPEVGDLASGDFGAGRLADPAVIVEAVVASLTLQDLAGVNVLVTAGPTREALDPVRFISNRSTGRMGFALAAEARRRGARVTVVAGPTSASAPSGVVVVRVETAEQMLRECLDRYEETDVAVLNAAVADWRPAKVADQKVKKTDADRSIEFEPTPDIAAELGRKKGPRHFLVLFAAETERIIDYATNKLEAKHADMVVANHVGHPDTGFDSETNDAAIVSAAGAEELPRMQKDDLARVVWDAIAGARGSSGLH